MRSVICLYKMYRMSPYVIGNVLSITSLVYPPICQNMLVQTFILIWYESYRIRLKNFCIRGFIGYICLNLFCC